jgi:hypothetical protein
LATLTLGERVLRLAAECRGRDLTLGELQKHIGRHSQFLLIFLMALPFCQPIPLLGVSTPFGLLLALLGLQLALGRELAVPQRFCETVIPKKFFPVLLTGAGRLLHRLEKHLRRRNVAFVESPTVRRVCGANIALCALLLSLPVPIPFSNVFPAIPIALTAAALLESDGTMLKRAAASAVVNLLFWATWAFLIAWFGWLVVEQFRTWLWT